MRTAVLAMFFVGQAGARIVLPGVPPTIVTPPGRVTRVVDRAMFVVPTVPQMTADSIDTSLLIYELIPPWEIVVDPLGVSYIPSRFYGPSVSYGESN